MNKKAWGQGPWDTEPDTAYWVSNNFHCMIVRNPLGALCGYVGLSKEHPWYGLEYGDLIEKENIPNVHGGITYAHIGHPKIELPLEQKESIYWLGFDCAHAYDVIPAMTDWPLSCRQGTYRDINYVKAEVEKLAAALQAVTL